MEQIKDDTVSKRISFKTITKDGVAVKYNNLMTQAPDSARENRVEKWVQEPLEEEKKESKHGKHFSF
jgi:hypothetical protein